MNIKPISDLKNYNEVLHDVAVEQPVFLTKNEQVQYVIVDADEYVNTQVKLRLIDGLAKGEKSGREKGWLNIEEIERIFG